MLRFSSFVPVLALAFAACSGDDEELLSGTAEPTADLTQLVGERPAGFPCPPFADVYVDESEVYGDNDGDGLSNCQEEQIGSQPGNADSDGDGIDDGAEMQDVLNPADTDNDGEPDYNDPDDDGDGCDTLEEGTDDSDEDGIPAYLDEDEALCLGGATGVTGHTGDTGTTTTTTTKGKTTN